MEENGASGRKWGQAPIWGQALSPGNVLFLPFGPMTFIWIRPDPELTLKNSKNIIIVL
jgi:hypothetical protein